MSIGIGEAISISVSFSYTLIDRHYNWRATTTSEPRNVPEYENYRNKFSEPWQGRRSDKLRISYYMLYIENELPSRTLDQPILWLLIIWRARHPEQSYIGKLTGAFIAELAIRLVSYRIVHSLALILHPVKTDKQIIWDTSDSFDSWKLDQTKNALSISSPLINKPDYSETDSFYSQVNHSEWNYQYSLEFIFSFGVIHNNSE